MDYTRVLLEWLTFPGEFIVLGIGFLYLLNRLKPRTRIGSGVRMSFVSFGIGIFSLQSIMGSMSFEYFAGNISSSDVIQRLVGLGLGIILFWAVLFLPLFLLGRSMHGKTVSLPRAFTFARTDWIICLDGIEIGRKFFPSNISDEEVKRILVDERNYDPRIEVKSSKDLSRLD